MRPPSAYASSARADVEGRAVGVGVHGDRPDAELAQSAEDADGDLSAVRDQDLGEHATYSPRRMTFADQLTVARIALAPVVVLLFAVDFPHHAYWGTVVFCIAMSTDWFDGRIARRSGKTSSFGSLLDPVADKVLVLATLVVLLDAGVFPAWMVAAIVGRELLISGLRLAALERGVVIPARDLGKLKTWSQAIAAVAGGLAAAGAWSDSVSWWLLLVSVVADVGLRLRLRARGAADPARPRRRRRRERGSLVRGREPVAAKCRHSRHAATLGDPCPRSGPRGRERPRRHSEGDRGRHGRKDQCPQPHVDQRRRQAYHDLTCRSVSDSPDVTGFAVGDRVAIVCRDHALRKLVRLPDAATATGTVRVLGRT